MEEDAVRADWRRPGLLVDKRIEVSHTGTFNLRRVERIAQPSHAQRSGVRRGNRIPHSRHDVRVGKRLRMRVHLGGHRVDVPRRRELDYEIARLDRARAVVLHRAVGGAADDRRSLGKPRERRCLGRHAAREVCGRDEAGEFGQTQSGQLDKIVVPLSLCHVEEERALRLDAVCRGLAREQVAHVVLHEKDVLRLRERLRLVRPEPHHLREGPCRSRHLVARREHLLAPARLQRLALRGRALVGPHDRAAHRPVVGVHKNRVVRRTVERAGRDRFEVHALFREFLERAPQRVPPVGRLLLAPSGMIVVGLELRRRLARERAVLAYGGHLAPACSVVYAQKKFHPRFLDIFNAEARRRGVRRARWELEILWFEIEVKADRLRRKLRATQAVEHT